VTDIGARPGGGVVAINHDRRATVERALHNVRVTAYGPGEFVGQESFMPATDILRLAHCAGVGSDTSVLDVCCGAGGPGLLIARKFGCAYDGVDTSPSAVRIARSRVGNLSCRFDVAQVPPLPPGQYDVVLLLETLLAFRDKATLLKHVCDALPVGGRFAFTLEEGEPLSDAERTRMPDADTVWLVPLPSMLSTLAAAGLRVTAQAECTESHRDLAQRLHDEFVADAKNISKRIGRGTLESLLDAHRLWIDWLGRGRVRKFMLVAEKTDPKPLGEQGERLGFIDRIGAGHGPVGV
jgi:SAM-dependent methyltransferase